MVTEADSESRHFAGDLAQRFNDGLDDRRISRTVRDEEAVRSTGADVGGGRGMREELNLAVAFDEMAIDIAFGTTIDGDNGSEPDRKTRGELIEQIEQIIQDQVDPENWAPVGETGKIQELNGNLIITNTARNSL